MRKLRATWLAVIGSILLLSLSVAGVFGHATSGFDMAASTVAFTSHSESDDPTADANENINEDTDADQDADEDVNEGADEDTDTDEDTETDEGTNTSPDELPGTDPEAPAVNHGGCVSAVAESDAVGSTHLNHGGAVSEAARVTCKSTDAPVSPQTDKQAAKDARQAARDATRAEHEANKATRTHGHSH